MIINSKCCNHIVLWEKNVLHVHFALVLKKANLSEKTKANFKVQYKLFGAARQYWSHSNETENESLTVCWNSSISIQIIKLQYNIPKYLEKGNLNKWDYTKHYFNFYKCEIIININTRLCVFLKYFLQNIILL